MVRVLPARLGRQTEVALSESDYGKTHNLSEAYSRLGFRRTSKRGNEENGQGCSSDYGKNRLNFSSEALAPLVEGPDPESFENESRLAIMFYLQRKSYFSVEKLPSRCTTLAVGMCNVAYDRCKERGMWPETYK